MALQAGSKFAGFELERLIASDALGEKYRALRHNQQVSLRIFSCPLPKGLPSNLTSALEARGSLGAHQITELVEFGFKPSRRNSPARGFIAQEWVEGSSLRALLPENGFSLADSISLSRLILRALSALHTHGIIHGCLSLEQIYTERHSTGKRTLRIDDAGFWPLWSLLTVEERTPLAPPRAQTLVNNLSPEFIQGQKISRRSDFYSLGCILYELLSGAPVFQSRNARVVMKRHLFETPLPLELKAPKREYPSSVQQLLNKLLEKRPEKRLPSAAAIDEALDAIQPASACERKGFFPDHILPVSDIIVQRGKSVPSKQLT